MQIKEDIINITKAEWEMIQAGFEVDLRALDEDGNPLPAEELEALNIGNAEEIAEIVKKYDFEAGTNPLSFYFEFDDGMEIYLSFYMEEFGGVVEWGFNNDMDSESEYWLEQRSEWDKYNKNTGESDIKYVCLFNII